MGEGSHVASPDLSSKVPEKTLRPLFGSTSHVFCFLVSFEVTGTGLFLAVLLLLGGNVYFILLFMISSPNNSISERKELNYQQMSLMIKCCSSKLGEGRKKLCFSLSPM